MSRKRKKGRELRLEVLQSETLSMDVPLRKYVFDVAPGQRTFVFFLEHVDRMKLSHLKLEQMAQTIGNLCHPHNAALIVVQPGAKLSVYEVTEPCHPPANGKRSSGAQHEAA